MAVNVAKFLLMFLHKLRNNNVLLKKMLDTVLLREHKYKAKTNNLNIRLLKKKYKVLCLFVDIW